MKQRGCNGNIELSSEGGHRKKRPGSWQLWVHALAWKAGQDSCHSGNRFVCMSFGSLQAVTQVFSELPAPDTLVGVSFLAD